MIRCLHCHAETSNGLALCDLCRRYAESALEYLPIYFRNLARWRLPARPNGSTGSSGQWLIREGETDETNRIGRVLDEAKTMLVAQVRQLADDRPGYETPIEAETDEATVALLCDSLKVNLTSVATTDWCGDLVRDLSHHERRLRSLTETAVPGWYAGACRQVAGFDEDGAAVRCGTSTYVVPGLTWVTCGSCGATTYARDHLEVVLDEAREWVAPPKRIAEAVVALVDAEQSIPRLHKRISKWGERGQIEALRRLDDEGDEVGPKRFRLGDVLDRLAVEGATRATATPADVVEVG